MRRNRHLCLAMSLVCALSTWAPAAAAAPDTAAATPAAWAVGWWQGAATWLVERLPFAGVVVMAAAGSDQPTAAPGAPEPVLDDGSQSEPMSLEGSMSGDSESGSSWDPNG